MRVYALRYCINKRNAGSSVSRAARALYKTQHLSTSARRRLPRQRFWVRISAAARRAVLLPLGEITSRAPHTTRNVARAYSA